MSVVTKVKSWFHQQKDASVSFFLARALREHLDKYGELTHLTLDSQHNAAQLDLLLKGEADPVQIFLTEYEVLEDASGTYVLIKDVRASREWLSLLARDFLNGRRFAIPEKYAALARLLL
jgi:hypothetical protein